MTISKTSLILLFLLFVSKSHSSPNPPIHTGCDLPVEVREDGHKSEVQCKAAGYCWGPGVGSPDCYRPHNDTSIKVYIHMMPWFETKDTNPDPKGVWGQHWSMKNMNPEIKDATGRRQIAAKYYPLIDLYASGDSHVIDWQLGLMKLSGVTGVLIDWPGTAKIWDYPGNFANVEAIIKGCEKVGLEFAIVYEDHNLGMGHDAHLIPDIMAQGKLDMQYLRDKMFSHKNYIQVNSAPLLLDFGPQTLTKTQYEELFQVFTTKPTFLVLWNRKDDGGDVAKGEFAWIYSNYLEGLQNFYHYREQSPLKFGCGYPGFESSYAKGGWDGPTWTIPVSVDTFEKTFDLARAFGINYLQVSTWNDYGEGTGIEPTKQFGYSFLKVLQQRLELKYTEKDLEKVTENYYHRKMHSNNQTMLDILEKEYFSIINS